MNKKFLSISLLVHASLLMIFIVSFPAKRSTFDMQPEQQYISSHIINTASSHTTKSADIAEKISNANKPAISQQNTTTIAAKTAPVSALTALLHAAIQREQQYPASAQEQEREGRVTLAFTLFPNGNISNLHIQKTSGTTSLDHAALAAVNAALPFQQVDRYLKSAENYQVDVVFALNV